MAIHYSAPLKFEYFTNKNSLHPRCDLVRSIRQHIYLILVTRFESNRYDPTYGCELWQHDFDSPMSINKRKHQLEQSIKKVLQNHETRLKEISVNLNISEEEVLVQGFKKIRKTKKRLEIKVEGNMLETNELFKPPPFIIYFSPISLSSDLKL